LELWLLSPAAQDRIDSMKTGISDSGLNLTHDRFLGLPVPVPPIEEQLRIVQALEDHLSRLEAGVAYLASGLGRRKTWEISHVDSLVWLPQRPKKKVGELVRERMRNGRSDRAVSGTDVGIRTLTLTAVTRNEYIDAHTKFTSTSTEMAKQLWLEPGDILVQRSNTPELVGTAARYEGEKNWAIYPDLLIRLRADESVIDSRYMIAALRSERAHRALRKRARGLSGTMPKIDHATLAGLEIPVPELEEQEEIIEGVAEIQAASASFVNSIEKQRKRKELLRKALLETAFGGRLLNGPFAAPQ